ncbi:MAG: hypothetical protein PHD01_17730 [Geobacteraceae bacterium]|nr:hypothetical protein [Geobacteraceae bacterium]
MKAEVRFRYEIPEGYAPVYVNGAHGGVSPRGEIIIHFYHERPPLPVSITHEITPAGTIGREIAQEPDEPGNTLSRAVDAGVILSYENAKNFHHWLGEKVKEMEALEKARTAFVQGAHNDGFGVTH